jgi:hypothetical protein
MGRHVAAVRLGQTGSVSAVEPARPARLILVVLRVKHGGNAEHLILLLRF